MRQLSKQPTHTLHLMKAGNVERLVVQLGPYFVPKGTGVHINLWAMQHDERYWQDPEVFKPERWLGDPRGGDKSGGLAYMPFGVGPRMCIGIKLARKFPFEQDLHAAHKCF